MKCTFCTEEHELITCSAQVRRQILVLPNEILANDLYCSTSDRKEYRVLESTTGQVQFRSASGDQHEPAQILRCEGEKIWTVCCLHLHVHVKRFFPCGVLCCFRHYREIANGVYRCKEHWVIGEEEPELKKWGKRKKARRELVSEDSASRFA